MRAAHAVCALAVAGALAGSGCGGKDRGAIEVGTNGTGTTGAPAPPGGKPVARIEVRETEYRLDPANPTVARAGVVEFVAINRGTIAHALEVEGPAGSAETATIAPGAREAFKVKLSKPGRYTWYCPVGDHRRRGMRGTVTVRG